MMHFEAFERPMSPQTLALRRTSCRMLGARWLTLSRRVQCWATADLWLRWLTLACEKRLAAAQAQLEEVWTEILLRFESTFRDACLRTHRRYTAAELEQEFMGMSVACFEEAGQHGKSLAESLWRSVSRHLNLDGVTHLDLRRRFHLRELLDEMDDAGDHRAAVRFFAFGTGEEHREQVAEGSLDDLYPQYRVALETGYRMFAKALFSRRGNIAKVTCGAINSNDLPSELAALKLIAASLAGSVSN